MNADPAPYSAEHDEPWPGGRSNHYLFDMNRDWFAQSQPETRGRIRIGLEFQPQITVDLHEQGGDNAYYFSPPAEAINPHVTKSQIAGWELLGRANAARFDERGWAYYIREVYDAFYPGYGDSWPTFQGSIGKTYEQASARGLAFARSDGDTLTYRDGVMHHFNAAIVTAITAARNREQFMRDYLEYRRSAIAEGEKGPIREYVIVPGQDQSRADALARNLATQGIEVRRAEEPIKLGGRTIPAGAYIVSNAQPTARMIRNLLDPKTEQSAEFIKKQEERRKMRLNDQIYDITAWNLPMLFDVEMVTSPSAISVKSTAVPSQYDAQMPARALAAAKVGYLMPWGSAAVSLSADAMRQGIRISSVGGAFTQNGRRYPIGTAFIRNAGNPADLNAKLAALAAKHGAELVPIDSTWVDEGTSLGSNDVAPLKTPKVLLAWDTPTSTLSAGWARYALERRFGVGVTAVRTGSLGRANFNDYDVIVLPSGNYAGQINEARAQSHQGLAARRRHARHYWRRRRAGRRDPASGLLDTTTLLKDGRPDVPPPSGSGGSSGSSGSSAAAAKPGRVRLRQGDPAGSRAARVAAGRDPARHARYQSLADRRQRRRNAGDDRRQSRVCAAQAEQRPQRRRLCDEGQIDCFGPDLARCAGHPRAEGLPDAPALRPGTRHCVCRGAELSCVHRVDDAAVHECGDARARLLTDGRSHGGTESRSIFYENQ